jgi:hypothetical protein
MVFPEILHSLPQSRSALKFSSFHNHAERQLTGTSQPFNIASCILRSWRLVLKVVPSNNASKTQEQGNQGSASLASQSAT